MDDDCCPLCVEPYEAADRLFLPCPCGYAVCMFCWNKIREVGSGQCPACRTVYSDTPAFRAAPEAKE
jgi:CCR4-NOT transcription complex subunit 4